MLYVPRFLGRHGSRMVLEKSNRHNYIGRIPRKFGLLATILT